MFSKKINSERSGFPFLKPLNLPESTESYDDFLQRLESLFNGEDAEAYFQAIEGAPTRWQRKPELMVSKAVGHFRSGEDDLGMQVLDEVERIHPKYAPVYYYKAMHYFEQIFIARALRMIHKVRMLGELDDEAESQLSEMESVSRSMLQESGNLLGASFEIMEKASWGNEVAQEKLEAGQWQAAEQHTREALRLIPNWASPRNNRAFVLYYMGKTQEAISEARKVLEAEPDNFHALKNLVVFHVGLNEEEKAREYADALWKLVRSDSDDSMEVDAAISVFGLLNEHETLWELAQKYVKRKEEDLLDVSWHVLGIAALHKGQVKEAQKLLEKAEPYYEPARELAIEVRKSIKEKTRPSAPSFYYSSIGMLLPAPVLNGMIEILSKHQGEGDIPPYIMKKLDDYLRNRPYVINALLRMLPDPFAARGVPGMLLSLNRRGVDARLLEFALGSIGGDDVRLNVLSAMAQEGRKLPPNPIRFWNAELSEWREVDFSGQLLSDDVELKISEEAAVWANKAQETDDSKEKISYLRKAVQLDPHSGFAVHMLGVFLMNDGQKEEGMKYARKAVEVDPSYMFAYANLALLEAQEEKPNEALVHEYTTRVLGAPVITIQTAFIAHIAAMYLAFDRKELETARNEYEIASELRPDDPMLDGWDVSLKFADVFSGSWLEKWQSESREKAHNKTIRTKLETTTTSDVTLNSLTRDALGNVARFWGIAAYGRKAELIQNISTRMRDEAAVDFVLGKLSSDEKAALQAALEKGGALSFQAFTEKYGNDLEESPHWNFHEPKTIMGRLRQAALLAKGTLDHEQVLYVPADVRDALKKSLGE
ncbi:MAG: hypothetical protein AABZ00_02485 [Chloroflexota bacterium]